MPKRRQTRRQTRKHNRRHRRQRRHKQTKRLMKGGAFTQQELSQLQNNGFNEHQIEQLNDLGVTFNEVMQHVNTIMNQEPYGFHGNSDALSEQVMVELLNEHIFDNINEIPQAEDDQHNMDIDLDNSFDTQGTMNLSELNDTQGTMNLNELNDSNASSTNTTQEDISFGGRRRKTIKRRKTNKRNYSRRHLKGGTCYGRGVGSNNYDPNYSIYNTNMMKLFPYKPT